MGGHSVIARLVQTDPFDEEDCIRGQVATRSANYLETLCSPVSHPSVQGYLQPRLTLGQALPVAALEAQSQIAHSSRTPPREMGSLTRVSSTQLKGL